MAKTTEQLLLQAVQIRDEQANKKNTALRVGTLFSDIIEKQEEDVTALDKSVEENKDKLSLLGNNVFRTGSGGYLPWQAGKTYNDGDVVIAPDGQLVECIGGTTSTSEYDPGEWAATTVDEQSRKRDTKISNIASSSGHVVCQTSASIAAKTITVDGITEITDKLRLLVQMNFANTAGGSVTLNINKLGAKTLYYNGATVSAVNTWETGEIVELYYANGAFQCFNAKGGSGSGGNMILEWNTDATTTRMQVAAKDRKKGMQISYNDPNKGWINEQYVGTDVSDKYWGVSAFWEKSMSEKDVRNITSNAAYIDNFSAGCENIALGNLINGFISANGEYISSSGFISTDFIEIAPNTYYSIMGKSEVGSGANTVLYDESKTKIRSWQPYFGIEAFLSDSKAKYLRISAKDYDSIALYKGICNVSSDGKEVVPITGGKYGALFDLVKTKLYDKHHYIRKGYAPFGNQNNIGNPFTITAYSGASSTLLIPVKKSVVYYLDGLTIVNNIVTLILDSELNVYQKIQATSLNGNGKMSINPPIDGYLVAAIDSAKIDSFYVSLVENNGSPVISIPKSDVQNAVVIPQGYDAKTIKWKNKRIDSQSQNLSVLVMDCYGLPFDSGDELEFYVKYITENIQTSVIKVGYSIQTAGQQNRSGNFSKTSNAVENGMQKEARFSITLTESDNVLFNESDSNLGFVFWTDNEDASNEYTIEVIEAYIHNVTKGYYVTRPITLGFWGSYQEDRKYPRVVSPSKNFATPLYNNPFITNSTLPIDDRSCKGLRILCLGDSITEGTAFGYVRWLQYCTGAGIQNVGSSGAGINRLVKILCGWNGWDGNDATSAIDLSNFDIVTIQIGTNGSDFDTTIDDAYTEHTMWDLPFNDGSEDITSKEQFATKYLKSGFLNNYQVLIQYILTENPNIKIFLITPPICERETWTLAERRMAQLQSLANYYNIPMINAYKAMCWNKWIFKENFSNNQDGTHLNEIGNRHWGVYIGNFINQFFAKDKLSSM